MEQGMTAEIAVLNKTAVALATDSAITIAAGKREEKIFDSGDKLFELSARNPIGVMIYNNMQFCEIPLPVIIKDFRRYCREAERAGNAADEFLIFLNQIGEVASERIQLENIQKVIFPIVEAIDERIREKLSDLVAKLPAGEPVETLLRNTGEAIDEVLAVFEKRYSGRPRATFVGGKTPRVVKKYRDAINQVLDSSLAILSDERKRRVFVLLLDLLKSDYMSGGRTGIVVAGFGSREPFPALIAYEIDGMVFGKLKIRQIRECNIERTGERAAVIPFAQKEMVERFLHGLDEDIQNEIISFARRSVSAISDGAVGMLEFSNDEEKRNFSDRLSAAEAAFIAGLREAAFGAIRKKSQAAIEDIVEFMPKPEIAKMAEALVELTSIKRRVSRGMETVREPIDVAVISRAEGFVWVKRKYYFDPAINPRYLERLRKRINGETDVDDRPNEPAG